MAELFNIYCDESCHLERDGHPVMVLGAVWCKSDVARAISDRIKEIKLKHGIRPGFEIKWCKVSPAKLAFYSDLVDYFFDDDDLHFRGVLIPNKSLLDHPAFCQNHDDWYYKMCFTLLEPIIDPTQAYFIYLDIKDTKGEVKRAKLESVLRSSRGENGREIIRRVQQIRSHESAIMQLADLLIGAVGHHNRDLHNSAAKRGIITRIQQRSRKNLSTSTWLREPKFNLLRWTAKQTQ